MMRIIYEWIDKNRWIRTPKLLYTYTITILVFALWQFFSYAGEAILELNGCLRGAIADSMVESVAHPACSQDLRLAIVDKFSFVFAAAGVLENVFVVMFLFAVSFSLYYYKKYKSIQ